MATKIAPSLRAALERLKHAGAVNGICLAWRRQVLVNLLPFEDFRADGLVHALLEAREHYAGGEHEVNTFWFGYDGVYLLGKFSGDCTLAVLHSRAVDVDFLAKAINVFLSDTQLLVDAALNPSGSDVSAADTQRLHAVPEFAGSEQSTRLL